MSDQQQLAPLRALDDQAWFAMLVRSLSEREIDGIRFPGFPPAEFQRRFVGADGETTLREALQFYRLLKSRAAALGQPIGPGQALLDFGCGWGRFLRFFWRDVGADGLHGCDISAAALAVCRASEMPGQLDQLYHWGRLPYADASMDVVMSYSVFTHLPERPHRHWVAEIARVLKPGGIFALTLEPRRFLEFIGSLAGTTDTKAWHVQLRRFSGQVPELMQQFDAGEFVFLPSSMTGDFGPEFYGDAVVPPAFVEQHWGEDFSILDYIDNASRFFQAVLIVQRK